MSDLLPNFLMPLVFYEMTLHFWLLFLCHHILLNLRDVRQHLDRDCCGAFYMLLPGSILYNLILYRLVLDVGRYRVFRKELPLEIFEKAKILNFVPSTKVDGNRLKRHRCEGFSLG